MKNDLNKLWARVGISLHVTSDEMEKIMCGTPADKQAAIARVFADGRAMIDGDSYIPPTSIAEYNRANGTFYDRYEMDLQVDLLEGKKIQLASPEREARTSAPRQKDRGDAR